MDKNIYKEIEVAGTPKELNRIYEVLHSSRPNDLSEFSRVLDKLRYKYIEVYLHDPYRPKWPGRAIAMNRKYAIYLDTVIGQDLIIEINKHRYTLYVDNGFKYREGDIPEPVKQILNQYILDIFGDDCAQLYQGWSIDQRVSVTNRALLEDDPLYALAIA